MQKRFHRRRRRGARPALVTRSPAPGRAPGDGARIPEAPLRNIDVGSWDGLLSTLIGLALVTLLGVGVRLLLMVTIQQRRERLNRQINERLRTLIAAYKVLGGSFTGELSVDPTHLRDLRRRATTAGADAAGETGVIPAPGADDGEASDRTRRIRDAVEAALSDIVLLGTEEHVRLAATAATELAAGRPVHTRELVVSLRDFIRKALDLDPVPAGVVVPAQGPARPSGGGGGGGRGKGEGGQQAGRQGGGGGGGMGGGGMGGGMGMGMSGSLDDGSDEPLSGSRR